MDYRHLLAFVTVAEELHFSRAAERLNVAQPALSQQIRQLERELGLQLFDRDTRSVRLTSTGYAMLEPAKEALDSLDTARRAALAGGKGELGRIHVGFAGASSHSTLPRLAGRVREQHPGLHLVLHGQVAANAALNRVSDGSLDLGFVRLPVTMPGIETRILEREELLAAVPSGHPLARRAEVHFGDLADEQFVLPPAGVGSSVRDITLAACARIGFTPAIAQEADDSYTILALVSAGVGVAVTLSSIRAHIKNDAIAFVPLRGGTPHIYSAIAWRRNDKSPALRAVLEVVEEEFEYIAPPDAS